MIKRSCALVPGLIWLVLISLACASPRYKENAEKAVPLFHDKLNAGKYEEIYNELDDEFKKISSKEDFIKLCETLREKLGNVTETKPQGSEVRFEGGRMMVVQVYDSVFAKSTGAEQFIWYVRGDDVKLAGYHIKSPVLDQ